MKNLNSKEIKIFIQPFPSFDVIGVCSVNSENNVFVKYVKSGTQDEINDEIFKNKQLTPMINKIKNWCSKKAYILYSYSILIFLSINI